MREHVATRPAGERGRFPTLLVGERVERGQQSLMRFGATGNLCIERTRTRFVHWYYRSPVLRCGTTTTVPSASWMTRAETP